jgi:hypothetical protein
MLPALRADGRRFSRHCLPDPVSAVVPVPAENQTAISAGKLKMRKNLVASLIDKCISVHPMDGTYLARIFKTEALNVN